MQQTMTNLIKREMVVIVAACAFVLVALIGAPKAQALVTATLDPGATGADVTELQLYLAKDPAIYPEGLVTGYYGPLTVAAVQRFQCTYGIVCSGDLASTGYGRVGPVTLAKIQSFQGGSVLIPGVPNTGGVGTADESAPIMTQSTITVSANSATFSWMTNEPSENSVIYGLGWPFYIGTAPSAWSSTFGTSALVTIHGLLPNHTYSYVRQSVDATGNVQYDMGKTFTTLSQ